MPGLAKFKAVGKAVAAANRMRLPIDDKIDAAAAEAAEAVKYAARRRKELAAKQEHTSGTYSVVNDIAAALNKQSGVWLDLQERGCCHIPCICRPPYFKILPDETGSDVKKMAAGIASMDFLGAKRPLLEFVQKPVKYCCGCCPVLSNPAVLLQLPGRMQAEPIVFEKPRPIVSGCCAESSNLKFECCGGACPVPCCCARHFPGTVIAKFGHNVHATIHNDVERFPCQHTCFPCCNAEYLSISADGREAYRVMLPAKPCCGLCSCLKRCKCCFEADLTAHVVSPSVTPSEWMVQAPQPLGMIQCYDNNNFGGGGVKDKYRITFPPTATLSEKLGLLAAALLLHNPEAPAAIGENEGDCCSKEKCCPCRAPESMVEPLGQF